MDNQDAEWINAQLDETVEEQEGEFELQMILSTDGKHTVMVKAVTKIGRKQGLEYAQRLYERVVQRYGTKQNQVIKEYKQNGLTPAGKKDGKVDPETCRHADYETVPKVSQSEKNPGRGYVACSNCGKWLHWLK
jgi:hypothetical protein